MVVEVKRILSYKSTTLPSFSFSQFYLSFGMLHPKLTETVWNLVKLAKCVLSKTPNWPKVNDTKCVCPKLTKVASSYRF